MPITFKLKGSSYLCSQITGGVENAGPLHVNIPCTGRRGFDLPAEDAVQEYFKFPYDCFLWVTSVNFVLQTTLDEKITRIKIR
jgi:hypothetical protein